MTRLLFLLILTFFTMTTPLTAQSLTCIDPFSAPAANPLRVPAEGVLSDHELKRVEHILKSNKPGNERWTEVANMYLNARLRLLPIEQRDSARKILTGFRPDFTNITRWEASTKGMDYPYQYAETPLPYVIMIHEWEHIIRSFVKSGGHDIHAGSAMAKFNPAAMYIEEAAAIRAEWELARFITDKEAAELIQITKELTNDRKTNSVVEAIATNRNLDRSDYLNATRASGRYSVINVMQKTALNNALAGAAVGYLSAVGGGMCSLVYWLIH